MGGTPSQERKDDLHLPNQQSTQVRGGMQEDGAYIPLTPLMDTGKEPVFSFGDLPKDPSKELSRNENYGIIPLNVLNNIMLFLRPNELLTVMLTCKLFSQTCNNLYFWNSYYMKYFKERNPGADNVDYKINWKKQFFKRFYSFGDQFFKKKYRSYDGSSEGCETSRVGVYKIVLVGEFGAGKSAFRRRIIQRQYIELPESDKHSDMFTTKTFEYDTKKGKAFVRLEIWDPMGQERYGSIAPMFYRASRGAFVFFGVDSMDQFVKGKRWVKELKRRLGDDCFIVVVGTKSDLCDRRKVDYEENVKDWIDDNGLTYVEISAKHDVNIHKALGLLIDGVIGDAKRYYERYVRYEEDDCVMTK